jgi:hypothetical protein
MEKRFVIKDSDRRFNGTITICKDPYTKETKWEYYSNTKPIHCNIFKENVELKVQRLQELNNLAGFDLTWEVVEIDRDDMIPCNTTPRSNFSIKYMDVQRGCIGKHRKFVDTIYKKYKSMVKESVV